MTEKKPSYLNGSLLWFGAAVSIAEIFTGALLAPLGLAKGTAAIIIGHIIGCSILYFAGLIGAKSKRSAMETVRFSFGRNGSVFFSLLNITQLLGWTAVMIIVGARAFDSISLSMFGYQNNMLWCILMGALILAWVAIGVHKVDKLNFMAVGSLFILTIILGLIVFKGGNSGAMIADSTYMSFGMGMELSVAMPLSWLPLISDYTRHSDKPVGFTLASAGGYFFGSVLMYLIGLGAALYSGGSDIGHILTTAGLGIAALAIVLLSTVTTTYLDVYSVGESMVNINEKFSGKACALMACVLGTFLAMFTPIEQYENFLYLIGSVFAPMATILLTDYFILGKREKSAKFNLLNFILWVTGFIIYRYFLKIDTVMGSTLPVMAIVSMLCVLVNLVVKNRVQASVTA